MLKGALKLYIERSDLFIKLISQHLMLSAISIAIAAVLGLLLGIYISENKKLAPFVMGAVNTIYTIPSISLFGLFIPITGIGDKTAVIVIVLYGILPMVRGTYTGIDNIEESVIEAAVGMGSTPFQILYKIKLPLAAIVILSGLRNLIVMTISVAGIASFIGSGGMGVAIYRGIATNNQAMTIAGSLLIAAMALISDFLLGLLELLIKKKRRIA